MESAIALTSATTTAADLLIWWSTLDDDEQELLRVTFSRIPEDQNMLAFLATIDCPIVMPTGEWNQPYQITHPGQLRALLSQL